MAIDPHGHLHGRLGALEQGTLVASVKGETRITGYTRFGWLAPWMILGVAALGWLKLLLPVKKKAGDAANGGNIPC
jgi:apolipoprotein N-acyltransferase